MPIQLTSEEAKWAQKYAKQLSRNASMGKFVRWLGVAVVAVLLATFMWVSLRPKDYTDPLDKLSTLSDSDKYAVRMYVLQEVSRSEEDWLKLIPIVLAVAILPRGWWTRDIKDSILAKVIRSELLKQDEVQDSEKQ